MDKPRLRRSPKELPTEFEGMCAGMKKIEMKEVQNEFSSPWPCSDVVLLVQGRQLHSSKALLSMVSPVLGAMFPKDSQEKPVLEVTLPGKQYDDIVEFFRCIHPHVNKDVTDEWLQVLLSLAEEYQCQMLIKKCRAFLETQVERCRMQRKAGERSISGEAVLRWLRLAGHFRLDESVLQGLVEELEPRMEAEQLTATEDFEKLDSVVMRLLFRRYMNSMREKINERDAAVRSSESARCDLQYDLDRKKSALKRDDEVIDEMEKKLRECGYYRR